MKKILNEKFSKLLLIIGVPLIVATIILFFWGEVIFSYSSPINSEKFGHFGDFVGGLIGSMWAAAGVILFYIALVEQRKDFLINNKVMKVQVEALNQQIKEFELQRDELKENISNSERNVEASTV